MCDVWWNRFENSTAFCFVEHLFSCNLNGKIKTRMLKIEGSARFESFRKFERKQFKLTSTKTPSMSAANYPRNKLVSIEKHLKTSSWFASTLSVVVREQILSSYSSVNQQRIVFVCHKYFGPTFISYHWPLEPNIRRTLFSFYRCFSNT